MTHPGHRRRGGTHPVATTSAGLLLAGVLAVPAPAVAASEAAQEYRQDARAATNQARDRHDLGRLEPGRCLRKHAAGHARRMAERQRIWHQDLQRVLRDCSLSFAGENVAHGYRTGQAVVRAWMGSPKHRENILEPRFRRMEVVARRGADGRWYATQLFGRP